MLSVDILLSHHDHTSYCLSCTGAWRNQVSRWNPILVQWHNPQGTRAGSATSRIQLSSALQPSPHLESYSFGQYRTQPAFQVLCYNLMLHWKFWIQPIHPAVTLTTCISDAILQSAHDSVCSYSNHDCFNEALQSWPVFSQNGDNIYMTYNKGTRCTHSHIRKTGIRSCEPQRQPGTKLWHIKSSVSYS